MKLSNCGRIVESQLVWLQEQYEQVNLEKSVIMPNHVHLLLTISYPTGNGLDRSLQKQKSLSSLIGAFKTTCSKLIHQSENPDFKWQKSFYDHIIRSEREYGNIWDYIHYNPLKWEWDAENRENSKPDKKYYERLFEK
jgi:putative transposase